MISGSVRFYRMGYFDHMIFTIGHIFAVSGIGERSF